MKRITEMTTQEWKETIRNNEALARALEDRAMDNATHWIEEYLHDFPGVYCIDACGYSYVRICDDIRSFLEWFSGVQGDYELFNPDDAEAIEEYISVANKLYTGDYDEDEEDEAEAEAERLKDRTEDIVCRKVKSEYNIDDDVLLDFVDEWIDGVIGYRSPEEEECFLHDDFTIVHHVPLKVVEAHEVKII